MHPTRASRAPCKRLNEMLRQLRLTMQAAIYRLFTPWPAARQLRHARPLSKPNGTSSADPEKCETCVGQDLTKTHLTVAPQGVSLG